MHSSPSRDSISQCDECSKKEAFLLRNTQTHTDRQTIIFNKSVGRRAKKFNLIIIIIPNFLACECLFLFTAEMEVILAIIILLCATFQRYCRHRRDCKLLSSPIATVVDMQTNGKHWRVFFASVTVGNCLGSFHAVTQ